MHTPRVTPRKAIWISTFVLEKGGKDRVSLGNDEKSTSTSCARSRFLTRKRRRRSRS